MDIWEDPTSDHVEYSKGYKYQLRRPMSVYTPIIGFNIQTDWIRLDTFGQLTLARGYASDGPSGPSVDTKSFMRGAFGHDGLYQLIREGHLPAKCKALADRFLHDQCVVDGMWKFRAAYVEEGVCRFGGSSILPSGGKEVLIAP